MANEEGESAGAAYETVGYYIQRWKTGRFHYVLKSGCRIEKLQERDMGKMKALILMYSVIAVFIMNLTYSARINPQLPCTVLFEEEEWKMLYCAANRTKKVPDRPYRIKQAVDYVGWLGGQNGLPVMGRRESKPFGPDFKNFIRSWTTVNYSILWVKFRP
ncbi:MAG: hypothetical protein LBP88_06515 [Treponema sp.]|jgi:hypothetical protein|nr:hypothetical protein [Treponema sp.]